MLTAKSLDNVQMTNSKSKLLTVRAEPDIYVDFATVAHLNGLTISARIHQFVVKDIREEKKKFTEEEWEAARAAAMEKIENRGAEVIKNNGKKKGKKR